MSVLVVRRVMLVAALVLLLGLVVMPASAQCSLTTDNPGNSDAYNCDGTGPGTDPGIYVGEGDDTVEVTGGNTDLTGAEVGITTLDAAIVSDGNGTLTVIVIPGSRLRTDDDVAILVDGDGNVVARGFIRSSDSGGIIITGNGNVVFGEGDPDSTLRGDMGIFVAGSGEVTNYAEVRGRDAGIVVGLENLFSGETADTATIINNGTETNNEDASVFGDIVGMGAYGYGTMNNYGDVSSNGVGMVFISQISIDEEALEDLLTSGGDLEILLTGLGDVINSIEFEGEITMNNDGTVEAPVGILLLGNGTANNSGTINAGFLGMGAYGNADINNSGTIQGALIGTALIGNVKLDTEFISDLFTAPEISDDELGILFYIAAALNAIDIGEGGTITNSGDIYDVAIGALQLGTGDVVNTAEGDIEAEWLGMGLYGNGNVVNAGEIATNGVGMLLIGDISVDDEVFFNLESAAEFFTNGDLFGPVNFGGGNIVNSGYVGGWTDIDPAIIGIGAIGNVSVTNTEDGDVGNSYVGIGAVGPTVTVNNAGEIYNTDVGVIAAGDNVTVNNSGVIEETGVGVTVYGNGTVNNAGVIDTEGPAVQAYGNVTVNLREGSTTESEFAPEVVGDEGNQTVNVNSGVNVDVIPSIQDVIVLNGGQDRVNLRSDANVNGSIDMGDGDDTVQIGSGSVVEGTLDGGSEDNADLLIVGDETICGEAEGASERFFGNREFVESLNPEDDTFNFDGEDYTVYDFEVAESGVRQNRCFEFIEDGRINAYDMGAPVAGYCNTLDGVNVWAIDADGNGQVDFSVSGEQMRTALQEAVTSGQSVLVAQGVRGTTLYALASNQYQMMGMQLDGKTYVYIFEPGRCGPSAVYTAE